MSETFPTFSEAVESGTVTDKSGYHQPNGRGVPRGGTDFQQCGCSKTTEKGAYRDVTVEMPDGRTVHFYHQSAVVVVGPDGTTHLNSHGYRTSTTKERINRHTPAGYRVTQEDFEWYLDGPGGRTDFSDGMTIRT